MAAASNGGDDALAASRHMRYFQRCFRTMLPRQYMGNDSTRMTLGFFIIAAMDLLTPAPAAAAADDSSPPKPDDPLTSEDRRRVRDWVLSAQHPHGGFCGSPTHVLPAHEYDGWDFEAAAPAPGSPGSANIAATAFALLLLALVADPAAPESAFAGVHRAATLRWLRGLQRPDGSFGEVLVDMPAGPGATRAQKTIAGGRDMRYCYIASMIRWILRGGLGQGDPGWVEDIDVEALARYIRQAQTFDGGVGESSMHESHAGYAYCAVSALSLLERPPEGREAVSRCGMHVDSLLRFLASRQLAYQDPAAEGADGDPDEENFPQLSALSREAVAGSCPEHVGLNGRCNKVADTCYTWWVAGTLDSLRRQPGGGADVDIAREPARRFLMDKTQHLIGGFSKHPGGPPDVYHSYLGLAVLAAMGEPGLKEFDEALCVSSQTAAAIESGRRGLLMQCSGRHKTSCNQVVRLGELMAGCEADILVGNGADMEAAEGGQLLEQLLSRRMQMTTV
ncbi:hypothetical protein RB595_010532 [Gaeumannomyces hyphopodioides]